MSGKKTKLPDEQTQVAFRLPNYLLDELDAHVEDMEEQMPGVKITRADAVRSLLIEALGLNDPPKRRRG